MADTIDTDHPDQPTHLLNNHVWTRESSFLTEILLQSRMISPASEGTNGNQKKKKPHSQRFLPQQNAISDASSCSGAESATDWVDSVHCLPTTPFGVSLTQKSPPDPSRIDTR